MQSRSANKVNEITNISNSTGTAWNTPLYDPAGNKIGIPNGGATVTGATPAWVPFTESQWTGFTEAQWNAFTEDTGTTPQQITAQYDAWNRLVKVTTTPLNFVEHVYDGRGFRIGRRTTVSNTVTEDRHYYYTPGWQCLEERVGSVTTAERQFVWGLRYIDDLVIRDRSTANNGTINERRYAMQDGNWNSIAICDSTGSVGERYAYSAYGAPVFMTGAGTVQTSSPVGFETLYAGYRWDNPAPQMYYVRNRFLLPQVGTWNKRDPLGYRSQNASLYVYARNNSIYYIDPLGLDEIDDYHRDLFNYYQSLMQVMILVGDELHANGTANLGKKFPWLDGKYNCTGGRARSPAKIVRAFSLSRFHIEQKSRSRFYGQN